ncbi:hypothetical protein VP01_889g6 [Puccinia sorghi]|uniref:HAT C-terminal dimerisation domain-containing protein n=1 Tax=Puccinia sorghi TaxID=27349 RepID=A0A0L6U881_9BASI|nr:hypothetical protein VP01_889g6 [Puccinia sorghi]
MAKKLHLQVPSFNTKLNLLGCVAHVINLAAKIDISKGIQFLELNVSTRKRALTSANILIQHLHTVQRDAMKTPVYICAMILDPKFKTMFWINNASFVEEHCNILVNNIINIFETELENFVSLQSSGREQPAFESAATKPQLSMPAKINQYLKEDVEPKGVKVLTYWANQCKTFPHLEKLACCFLSIPETSAASKQVSSNGRQIVSWKQAALQPASIEELLCLKDWLQDFDATVTRGYLKIGLKISQ